MLPDLPSQRHVPAAEPLSLPFIYSCASQMGRVLHLEDTWNYLKTFLMGTAGLGDVVAGTWWTELRDAGKHPTMQRISPHHKVYQVQGVNVAKAEKLLCNT